MDFSSWDGGGGGAERLDSAPTSSSYSSSAPLVGAADPTVAEGVRRLLLPDPIPTPPLALEHGDCRERKLRASWAVTEARRKKHTRQGGDRGALPPATSEHRLLCMAPQLPRSRRKA